MPVLPVRLVLVGCGGHASDVLSVVEALNDDHVTYQVIGYIDDDAEADDRRLRGRGISRVASAEDARAMDARFVMGIGYPAPRRAVSERLMLTLQPAPALVHPWARLAAGAVVGDGAVVFDGALIGPLATVGRFAMVGRNAVVGHDAVVSDHVSVMPGCTISGDAFIGVGAMLGANATVLNGRSVGQWSQLGAGAVLTKDLPDRCTAVGVPAQWSTGMS